MRLLVSLIIASLLATGVQGKDRHDWQAVAQLRAGERIRLSLKSGPVEGEFRSWTPQDVTMGEVTSKREDVLKIERFRAGAHGSRAKRAAIGAAIGFGGGFGVGAVVGRCGKNQLCLVSPAEIGAIVAGGGAVVGALIGGLLPEHDKQIIYSAK